MYTKSITMGYSVRDFLAFSLLRWLFSEEHPLLSAKYAAVAFVQLLMNAAQAKDYVETVGGLDPGLPNAYPLFTITNKLKQPFCNIYLKIPFVCFIYIEPLESATTTP